MRNLLIVEDDENKLNEIVILLRESFNDFNPVISRSYHSGKKALENEKFGVCIFDMNLPTYDVGGMEDGGRRRQFGGRELVKKLDKLQPKSKFIILTQFESFGEGEELLSLEDLRTYFKKYNSDNFIDIIFFSFSSLEWKIDLDRALKSVKND